MRHDCGMVSGDHLDVHAERGEGRHGLGGVLLGRVGKDTKANQRQVRLVADRNAGLPGGNRPGGDGQQAKAVV